MSRDGVMPDRPAAGAQLMSAGLLVAGGFLGSRLLGLLRNIVIGQQFGTTPELDAYFAAFRLPDLLFQLLGGAALSGALLPMWAQARRESAAAAHRLASAVLTLVGLGTALVAGVAFVMAQQIVPLTVPGMPTGLQQVTVGITRVLLLSAFFFSLSGLIGGILQGSERFLLPALAPLLYNAAIIAAALLAPRIGIEGLAWGVVVGAGLHLAIQLPGLRALGFVYRWTLGLREAGVRQVLRLTGPRLLGLVVGQLHFVVATVLATLLGPGSLAALSYAWVVLMMPIGVFGMALATAFFPAMLAQGADEDRAGLSASVAWGLRLVLFLAVPSTVGLFLLSDQIVQALFQRGEFGASATAVTAAALAVYAIGLPGHAALEVLIRAFYALRDTTSPFVIAVLGLVVNVATSLALMEPLGVRGLALGSSLAALGEACVAGALLWRRIGPWQGASSLFRVGLASAAMGVVVVSVRALSLPALLSATIAVGTGAVVFLALAWLLGSQELRWLVAWTRGEG